MVRRYLAECCASFWAPNWVVKASRSYFQENMEWGRRCRCHFRAEPCNMMENALHFIVSQYAWKSVTSAVHKVNGLVILFNVGVVVLGWDWASQDRLLKGGSYGSSSSDTGLPWAFFRSFLIFSFRSFLNCSSCSFTLFTNSDRTGCSLFFLNYLSIM